MTTNPQPPAAGEAAHTPKWSSRIAYCQGADPHPESIELNLDGVQVAYSVADDAALNLFPEIVTAMNERAALKASHAELQAKLEAVESHLAPYVDGQTRQEIRAALARAKEVQS